MTNNVRNTSKLDPFQNLVETGLAGSVEAQEARGQRELETSDVLPTDCGSEDRKELEAAGVVFGEKVKGDEIFTHVKLPAGWKKQRTDHSMYTDLVDEKGAKRASIFYKAAFYDRSAALYIPKR